MWFVCTLMSLKQKLTIQLKKVVRNVQRQQHDGTEICVLDLNWIKTINVWVIYFIYYILKKVVTNVLHHSWRRSYFTTGIKMFHHEKTNALFVFSLFVLRPAVGPRQLKTAPCSECRQGPALCFIKGGGGHEHHSLSMTLHSAAD